MKKFEMGVLVPLFAVGMSMGKADARPQEPMQPTQQDKPAKVYNPFVKFFTE